MKKIVLIVFPFLLFGCVVRENNTELITYKPLNESKGFTIEIPKGYKTLFTIGNSYCYQFDYKDNASFYISEERLTPNWENLPSESSIFYNNALSAKNFTFPSCDTIVFSGSMNDSLYWKEQLIYYKDPLSYQYGSNWYPVSQYFKTISLGYLNVSKEDTLLFNKCIQSLTLLQDNTIGRDPIIIKFLKKEKKYDRTWERKMGKKKNKDNE